MTQTWITTTTGVVLAGGRAQRMGGQDKGLLLLAGQPMVAHVIRLLRPQVGELLINANRHAPAYRQLGCAVVSDANDHFLGPLAGMLAALRATTNPYVLSAPCDSPLLPADYARRMHAALQQQHAELCVAHDGHRLQPVFALLSQSLGDSLSAYLEAGERKIDRWFARHRMATVDFADHPEMFRNINTPEELAALEAELMGP
ncbi:MAG: molybdenum cofactor guanylyltransferase MobA [Candidatus Competibacteraceae bacterium]